MTRRQLEREDSERPAPPGLWMLHISLQMFMLIVILLSATWSSPADGSMKMFPSVRPSVNERGMWARLSGCCTCSSSVTSVSCSFTKGLRTSSRASSAPFRMQSTALPSSQITATSTTTFQMKRPARMHSDYGSSALEPTITVSSSLAVSADSLRFSSALPWQLWQSTLKKTMPSLGRSAFGAVISTLVLMHAYVAPMRNSRWPSQGGMDLSGAGIELSSLWAGKARGRHCVGCSPAGDECISLGQAQLNQYHSILLLSNQLACDWRVK